MEDPTVTFIKAYPDAIAPLRADKAACGVLPTVAFRHCKPVRTASAFGWYGFPPEDVNLRWNGAETLIQVGGGRWQLLTQTMLPGMSEHWDRVAPEQCKGLAPPLVSTRPIPGHVQVWSGLLCKTAPGWSVGIRSVANMQASVRLSILEGEMELEAGTYGPNARRRGKHRGESA